MKKILLHSCCGPCSTTCIEELSKEYEVVIFYYNPNIFPKEEYQHRLNEQIRYAQSKNIEVASESYDEASFLEFVKGFENEKEGGARCSQCFKFRLKRTAEKAKEMGIDIFCTTLTVSPHKNSKEINRIGLEVENFTRVQFLVKDFKKMDGYKKSIDMSKDFGLYRQSYCGCRFSLR